MRVDTLALGVPSVAPGHQKPPTCSNRAPEVISRDSFSASEPKYWCATMEYPKPALDMQGAE